MEFSDDILQPTTIDQLAQYRAKCAQQLPHTLRGHHFLLMQERWMKLLTDAANQTMADDISDRCKFKFYVHREGQIDNCTFVAITETATHPDEYVVFVFTLEADCAELRQCVNQTKRIKWNFSPLFTLVHSDHMAIVNEIIAKNNYEVNQHLTEKFVGVWLPKEAAETFDYEIPADVYAAPLDGCVDTINNVWSHRDSASRKYISSLLSLNKNCIGIFGVETNELQAWILTNYRYAMAHLHTMDTARRRGFGKLLVMMWCKQFIALENADPIAYIIAENNASRKLFGSLGFEVFRESWHIKLDTFKN